MKSRYSILFFIIFSASTIYPSSYSRDVSLDYNSDRGFQLAWIPTRPIIDYQEKRNQFLTILAHTDIAKEEQYSRGVTIIDGILQQSGSIEEFVTRDIFSALTKGLHQDFLLFILPHVMHLNYRYLLYEVVGIKRKNITATDECLAVLMNLCDHTLFTQNFYPPHYNYEAGYYDILQEDADSDSSSSDSSDDNREVNIHAPLLDYAIEHGSIDIVVRIIEPQQDGILLRWLEKLPNKADTLFSFCKTQSSIRTVSSAEERDISTQKEEQYNHALRLASMLGKVDIVRYLLENELASTSSVDRKGNTALNLAITFGGYILPEKIELIKLLLEHQSPLSVKNGNDETPLLCSLKKYEYDIAQLLLEYGANPNEPNNSFFAQPPLHWAISLLEINYVKLLIKYGADPLFAACNGDVSYSLLARIASALEKEEEAQRSINMKKRETINAIYKLLITAQQETPLT